VPYRGSGPALTDLLNGQVQVMFDTISSSIAYIQAGKLRALAVTTVTRSELLPEVPTIAETVPGYELSAWFGAGTPTGTPSEIIEKLNQESTQAWRKRRSRRGLPSLAPSQCRCRSPSSASSSPTRPRDGPRWSSSLARRRTDPGNLDWTFHNLVRRTAAKTAVGTFLPCQPNNWRRKLRYVRISNAMTLKRWGHGKRKRADTRSYKHGPARPAIFSID
jgi:Tripartite tricarboxylate transporter family receptor